MSGKNQTMRRGVYIGNGIEAHKKVAENWGHIGNFVIAVYEETAREAAEVGAFLHFSCREVS